MSKTLRPSADAFRKAGWLPLNDQAYNKWLDRLSGKISHKHYRAETPLLPAVQEFQDFIEKDGEVYLEFNRMFEGVTESPKNYKELMNCFNEFFRQVPYYGSLGPPVYMVMAKLMNTQGGFSAFTKENLNQHFKKMFVTWAAFLTSPDSRYVLTEEKTPHGHGWFAPESKKALMERFPGRLFEEVFLCNPALPYYGYESWDDFFNRKFRDMNVDRPVQGDIKDLRIISIACESTLYNISYNVQNRDPLFIKDEAYSLVHLLNDEPVTSQFVGGTIIQGFLQVTGYHRWHSPVTGTISKIVNVPGTYFAQSPDLIGQPLEKPCDSNYLPPYLRSLRFFANLNARLLIFIESDNPKIGLMCFIAIGMTEISSCESTVYVGQRVNRGDQLGMFHFGGSSHCLVFRPGVNVKFGQEYAEPGTPLQIRAAIGVVE